MQKEWISTTRKRRARSLLVPIVKIYLLPGNANLPVEKLGKPAAGIRKCSIDEAYENKIDLVIEYYGKRQRIPYNASSGESVKHAAENPQLYVHPDRELPTKEDGFQYIYNFIWRQ